MSALFRAIIGGWGCVQNVRCTFPPQPLPLLLHPVLVAATSAAEATTPIQRLCFMWTPWLVRGAWLLGSGSAGGGAEPPLRWRGRPEIELGHPVGDQRVAVAAEEVHPEVDDPPVRG